MTLKKISLSNTALSSILLISGFCVEGFSYALFLAYKGQSFTFPLLGVLILHMIGVALFSWGMYFMSGVYRYSADKNWVIITAAMCFAFSYIGFIFCALLFIATAKQVWSSVDAYDDYEKYITYDYTCEKKYVDEEKMVEIVNDELLLQPLVDVMQEDDIKLRRGAVGAMKNLPKKDAVKLLKLSLSDNSVEIRFYAAVGLSEIESGINENIEMAKNEVDRSPESVDARIVLANSYAEYHECGILDDVTSRYYLDLAIKEYYTINEMRGGDVNILNSIGNLEAERQNFGSALSKFLEVSEIEPDNIFANVGIMQIFYETGKVSHTIKRAREVIGKMPKSEGPMREIIEYWATK